MFGSPETTPGGRALKFYSSVRLDIRRLKTITQGDESIGSRTRVKVVKNKVAPPFKVVEFDIMYGQGISKSGVLLDTAVDLDVVDKAGSWFSYKDEKLGQGREKVKDYLEENPELASQIEAEVRATINAKDEEDESHEEDGKDTKDKEDKKAEK